MEATSGIRCGGSMNSVKLCDDAPFSCDKDPIYIALKPKEKDPCAQMSAYNLTLEHAGNVNFHGSLRVKNYVVPGVFSGLDVVCQESSVTAITATRDVFLIDSWYGSVNAGGDIHYRASRGNSLEAKGNVTLYHRGEPKSIQHVDGRVEGDLHPIHPEVYLTRFTIGGAVIFPDDIKRGTVYLDGQSSIGNLDKTNGIIILRESPAETTSEASSSSDDAKTSSHAAATSSDVAERGDAAERGVEAEGGGVAEDSGAVAEASGVAVAPSSDPVERSSEQGPAEEVAQAEKERTKGTKRKADEMAEIIGE